MEQRHEFGQAGTVGRQLVRPDGELGPVHRVLVMEEQVSHWLVPRLDIVFKLVWLVGHEPLLGNLAVGGDEPVRGALVGGVDLRPVQQPLPDENIRVNSPARAGQHRHPRPVDVGDAGEVPVRIPPQENLRVLLIDREDRHCRRLSRVLDRLVRADVAEQDAVVLSEQGGRRLEADRRATSPDLERDAGSAKRAGDPVLVPVDHRVRPEELVGEPVVRTRPPRLLENHGIRADPLQRRDVSGRGR